MPEIVGKSECRGDARDGVLRELAQEGLEFAEGHLDRIKIWGVLGRVAKRCASSLDCLHDAGNFVRGQLIHDDDVVWFERRREASLRGGFAEFSQPRPDVVLVNDNWEGQSYVSKGSRSVRPESTAVDPVRAQPFRQLHT